MSRFRGGRVSADAFMDETLVVCPRCGGCGRVAPVDAMREDLFAPRKLTCASCGHSRLWENTTLRRHAAEAAAVDDYFELPLWIQAPCCGNTLWAYNWRHLEFIEGFVGALHRERRRDAHGWSNRALGARLPRWMKVAQNRVAILECVEKLRQTR